MELGAHTDLSSPVVQGDTNPSRLARIKASFRRLSQLAKGRRDRMGSLQPRSLQATKKYLATLTRIKLPDDGAIEHAEQLMVDGQWTIARTPDGHYGLTSDQLKAFDRAGIPYQVVKGRPFKLFRED